MVKYNARIIISGVHRKEKVDLIQEYLNKKGEILSGVRVTKGTNLFEHGGSYYAHSGVNFPASEKDIYVYLLNDVTIVFRNDIEKDSNGNQYLHMTIHSSNPQKLSKLEKILKKVLN